MGYAALKDDCISEDEYLAGEELTDESHEYIDGCVYAMAVPTDTHSVIQQNVGTALHARLRGGKCRAWLGNMRVRILFPRPIFYIPDVLVACDDPVLDRRFREQPIAIWEVLSQSTEATDTREKRHAYLTLPTLRSGEGMGVVAVVTGSVTSRCAALVRATLSPDDTMLVVATRPGGAHAAQSRWTTHAVDLRPGNLTGSSRGARVTKCDFQNTRQSEPAASLPDKMKRRP